MNLSVSSDENFIAIPRTEHWEAVQSIKKILTHLNPLCIGMHKYGYIEVDWGSVKTYRTAINSFPIPLTYKISEDEVLQVRHIYHDKW